MIILLVEGKCVSGISAACNMSNTEFIYFLLVPCRWLWSSSYVSHFTTEIVNVFYLQCLGLESSSNIILQHVFPPTCLNLDVGVLQGQLLSLQTQLSFRYSGHLCLWGSVCAQHATIAQALLVCPYVEDGEVFTLWWIALDTDMRAVWQEVYGIHSSRTPNSLKLGLQPCKPLI